MEIDYPEPMDSFATATKSGMKTLRIISWNLEHARIDKLEDNRDNLIKQLAPHDLIFIYENKIKVSQDLAQWIATELNTEAVMAKSSFFGSARDTRDLVRNAYSDEPRSDTPGWKGIGIDVGTNEYVVVVWRSAPCEGITIDVTPNDGMIGHLWQLFSSIAQESSDMGSKMLDPKRVSSKTVDYADQSSFSARIPAPVIVSVGGNTMNVCAWHAPRPNKAISEEIFCRIVEKFGLEHFRCDLFFGDFNYEPAYGEPDAHFMINKKEPAHNMYLRTRKVTEVRSNPYEMSLAPMYVPSAAASSTMTEAKTPEGEMVVMAFDSQRSHPIDFVWVSEAIKDYVTTEMTGVIAKRLFRKSTDHKPIRIWVTLP